MVSFLKMLPFVVFATVLVLFLIPLLIVQRESGSYYIKDPKTGKQQTVKSPNKHGNTLGNQPAERYKLVDRKTGKPLKSGETGACFYLFVFCSIFMHVS
jgi:hypothetical protein